MADVSKIPSDAYLDEAYPIINQAIDQANSAQSKANSTQIALLTTPYIKGIASKNLFDKSKVTSGSFVVYSNGKLSASTNYSVSDYTPVAANTYYVVSGTNEQCAFYDSSNVYISGLAFAGTAFQTPANAAYVRISMLNTQINVVQIEKGNTATSYEEFNPKIDNTNIKPNAVKAINIPDKEIPAEKLAFTPLTGAASKNLFDKSKAISGYYVNNGTGNTNTASTHYAGDYIAVLPGTSYRISGTTEQGAFYDSNKKYISGYTNASSVTVTPANAYYIRLSMLTAQVDKVQLEQGTAVTSYVEYGVSLDPNTIKVAIPESKLSLSPNIVRGQSSKNLFNKATVTSGFYVSYLSGGLSGNANENASDYIPILPSTSYRLSGTNEQLAFYDASKTFVSGLAFGGQLDVTPANAYYIRISVLTTQLDNVQLEKGTSITSYADYGAKIQANQLGFDMNYVNIVQKTVKVDGTGDFTNIYEAIQSITDASKNNQYEIMVYPGSTEYDIIGSLPESMVSNPVNVPGKRGLDVPNYVHLIGVGLPILKGELPDTATAAQVQALSTINLSATSRLENFIITAKNLRYVVHDETSGAVKDWTRTVKNCIIEHKGNQPNTWPHTCAWGEGCSSGSKSYFDNVTFIHSAPNVGVNTNAPYSTHNNTGFTNPSYHEFNNCTFINNTMDIAFRYQGLGSGVEDKIVFNNCTFNGYIWDFSNANINDFVVTGSGNTETPYEISNYANGVKTNILFSDEVKLLSNNTGAVITKGTPVKMTGMRTIAPMTASDDLALFIGIALTDISTGANGYIKRKGYISIKDTQLSGVSVGNKIGIVSGALSVVNDDKYIGVCLMANQIKLKAV